jgi:FkbM family methyltransferase
MINLKESLNEFNINCFGIIHVGGHKAQEYEEYKDAGLIHQVWIEANPNFFYEIINVIKEDNNCVALNYAVFDEEKEIKFGLANNGASSSILPLKEHLKYYPNIKYDGYLQMTTKRLDKIIEDNLIDLSKHDGLVMDVQGVELRVLKSLGSLLNNFKFVQSEVNLEELYEGCCLIDELDEYLKSFGFERKITKLWDDGAVGWGDALYIKND